MIIEKGYTALTKETSGRKKGDQLHIGIIGCRRDADFPVPLHRSGDALLTHTALISDLPRTGGGRSEVFTLAVEIEDLYAGDSVGEVSPGNELLQYLRDPHDSESDIDS